MTVLDLRGWLPSSSVRQGKKRWIMGSVFIARELPEKLKPMLETYASTNASRA